MDATCHCLTKRRGKKTANGKINKTRERERIFEARRRARLRGRERETGGRAGRVATVAGVRREGAGPITCIWRRGREASTGAGEGAREEKLQTQRVQKDARAGYKDIQKDYRDLGQLVRSCFANPEKLAMHQLPSLESLTSLHSKTVTPIAYHHQTTFASLPNNLPLKCLSRVSPHSLSSASRLPHTIPTTRFLQFLRSSP